jgi:hypothetical protein
MILPTSFPGVRRRMGDRGARDVCVARLPSRNIMLGPCCTFMVELYL